MKKMTREGRPLESWATERTHTHPTPELSRMCTTGISSLAGEELIFIQFNIINTYRVRNAQDSMSRVEETALPA